MNIELDTDVLLASDKEPGSYFNANEKIVLLRMPDLQELRSLWEQFDAELRSELKNLLIRPYGEIIERLGPLGFRKSNAEQRSGELFGMLKHGEDKSAHFRKTAIFQAVAALGLLPGTKAAGKPKKRLQRNEGRILEHLQKMRAEDQRAVIESIVDGQENLDDWMIVTQGRTWVGRFCTTG